MLSDARLTPDQRATAAVRERLESVESLRAVLPAIESAGTGHRGVYLVGGAVRDLLMDAPSVDIDLVVEGDALVFARDLASQLGCDVRVHEQFQTAAVRGGRVSIDVAATRSETYAEPGALPRVAMAGLREDLARRDFSINAMAASLSGADVGAAYDPYGGFDDLAVGLVRALHERSFNDDPTRLLRAVRYAARLGFELEPRTKRMAKATIATGVVGSMGSGRVRDELSDLLAERSVLHALELAHQLQLDRALHPRLDAGSANRELVAQLLSDAAPELAKLAALCVDMSPAEIGTWADRLKFSSAQRKALTAAATEGPPLAAKLSTLHEPPPSALHTLLSSKPAELLAMVRASSDRGRALVDFYAQNIAPVRLEITGDDLIAAGAKPGPRIGRALAETLDLKLDGDVAGKRAELEAALRVVGAQ